MTKNKTIDSLGKLFETSKRDNGDEYIHFRSEAMQNTNELYPIYDAVSNAMRESGLTHDFSYEIASRAVDILQEVDDWEDSDAITEACDNAVPVYTSELMTIYAANSWAVDEAVQEYGQGGNSDSNAGRAWYSQIRNMVEAIGATLTNDIIDAE